MTEHDDRTEIITLEQVEVDLQRVADPETFPGELEAYRAGLEDAGNNSDDLLSKINDKKYQSGVQRSGTSREGKAYIRGALGGFIKKIDETAFRITEKEGGTEEDARTAIFGELEEVLEKKKKQLSGEQRAAILGNVSVIVGHLPIDELVDYETNITKLQGVNPGFEKEIPVAEANEVISSSEARLIDNLVREIERDRIERKQNPNLSRKNVVDEHLGSTIDMLKRGDEPSKKAALIAHGIGAVGLTQPVYSQKILDTVLSEDYFPGASEEDIAAISSLANGFMDDMGKIADYSASAEQAESLRSRAWSNVTVEAGKRLPESLANYADALLDGMYVAAGDEQAVNNLRGKLSTY